MKWFKHFTDASDDEFIAGLENKFGLAGYARLWKLLEAVGAQFKKDGRPVAAYPWPVWQAKLKGKRKKLETFLVHLENKHRINQKLTGNILEIKIPKLLQIRDEYSKKSGHTPDKVLPEAEAEVNLLSNDGGCSLKGNGVAPGWPAAVEKGGNDAWFN